MTLDPNKALSQFIAQWEAQQRQQQLNRDALYASISVMMQMLHSGNVQEAFQYAGMVVMTNSMQCVGDNTSQFAGAEDLATGIRNIVAGLQGIFNEGQALNPDDAANFVKWLNEFWNNPNELNGGKACPPWIGQSDYASLCNSIKTIYAQLGVTAKEYGKLNTAQFIKKMGAFFPAEQHDAPDPGITGIRGAFQTLNNEVSSISSSATAQVQFWTSIYNQSQGVTNQILQSIGKFISHIVANQKSN